MEFETADSFDGDSKLALEAACHIFLPAGFELLAKNHSTASFKGPGMRSTKQNWLLGASEVYLACGGGRLSLRAELGGALTMKRFVTIFPPALGLFLALVFFFVFPDDRAWALGITGLAVMPWLVISPLMSAMIQRNTHRALEKALSSIKVYGESDRTG